MYFDIVVDDSGGGGGGGVDDGHVSINISLSNTLAGPPY